MIHVIAVIEVVDGRREDYLRELQQVVPKVRAEAGCIEYGPTVDVVDTGLEALQPPRANVVTVVEKWESLDTLKAHLAATHMNEYRKKVKDLVSRAWIHATEPVS